MARKRSRKPESIMRLRGVERVLFIIGSTVYLIGFLGATNLMDISVNTILLLLSIGGGLLLIINLTLIF